MVFRDVIRRVLWLLQSALAWTFWCGRLDSAAIQIESHIALLLCQLIFGVSLNVITRGITFRETAG